MTACSFRPLRLLGALCLCVASFATAAADDPNSTNGFTAPTYPASTAQQQQQQGSRYVPSGTTGLTNNQNSTPTSSQRTDARTDNLRGDARDTTARERIAPPKPGEFQKFVEGATGRMLPLFGSSFFRDAYDTYAPVDNVPVSGDYAVGPGDEIILRAWGSIDVDYRTTVDRNGLLNLPKIGSFNVSGVRASELEKHLRAQIGRLYTNFDLSVTLGQLRGLKVFVVGPAQRPGVLNLASQSTLLAAVVMAGGPSSTGSMRKVLLKRDGQVISELDMYSFLVEGDKSKDVQLAAGDVVVFQPVGPRVAVNGALDTPAIFELKSPQEPTRQVLRYAGGTPPLVNPNLAQLERIDVNQREARMVEKFKLDSTGLDKPLRGGDILTLLPISPQFANAVTLRGHVAQPLRYPYTPGMRIRDLIPDREALITPDFYRRKNLLVQTIDDRDDRNDTDTRTESRRDVYPDRAASNRDGRLGAPRSRDDLLLGASQDNTGNADSRAAQRNLRTDSTDSTDARDDGSVLRDDTNSSDSRADRNRRRADRMAVEANKRTPTPLFDELNWDYAVVERLNKDDLTTQVIPFNLGKAVLQGDAASNIELLPGDVVTIYSQKDIKVPVARQTRLVALEGEVGAPGIYQLMPGDTLQSLIARAGGFSGQAYVYGMEFSREETRQRQRENLTAAISRLEGLAAVQAARDAANRRDDPTGAATTVAVSNAAAQAQLARLRNLVPNGRIALELDPNATSLDALPQVPLEGGDRIVVPARPGFVTVAGAVVNSNAFLWRPGRTAGEYLRLAGADEAAETANMFILRADGTVTHAGDTRGFFGRGNLESQVMQPGDALIVPNQLDFETWGRAFVRNLKDFAQIFTGFGLGLAAVHTL
ncbi:MAG: SLBB domain-containing protein [Pseudomonadota bacterium]|nr:SLBB domain-containing protein [Pseudomonadota bacterium]